MPKDTVLIITEVDDVHADAVIRELNLRGVRVFRLHTDNLPTSVHISLEIQDGECTGIVTKPGRSLRLARVASAWLRRPRTPVPHSLTDHGAREYVIQQSRDLLRAMYAMLDVQWVGDPALLHRAEIKAIQLIHAHRAGLATPRTLIGNSPEECNRFRREMNGLRCAIKPLHLMGVQGDDGYRFPLTTLLPQEEPLIGADLAPQIIQPYVDKQLELRCVVIGDEVFCGAIFSQEQPETMLDWRGGDTRLAPYKLPRSVLDSVLSLVRSFGLVFASMDLILTTAGDYVFLELNPNGQWLWLEHRLGLPLTRSLADLLCSQIE